MYTMYNNSAMFNCLGMVTSCSSSPGSWTTGTRGAPPTPAALRCPTDADLSSKGNQSHHPPPLFSCPSTKNAVFGGFSNELS